MSATTRGYAMATCLVCALLLIGCGRKPATEPGRVETTSEAKGAAFEMFSLKDCTADLLDVAIGTNGFGVIGGVGVIFVTHDFGANWRAAYGPVEKGPEFGTVILAGPKSAWCMSRSLLVHTTDGGQVWEESAKPPGNFYYFGSVCLKGETMYMMQPPGCGAAVHTTRNGQAWDKLPAILPRNDYEAIEFVSDKHGWVAGNYGRFAATADGGRTWSKRDVKDDPHVVQVQFLDPANGWARSYGTGQRLRRTVDSGISWRQVEAVPPPARAVRDMQWFTTDCGIVLAEVKTGKTQVLGTEDAGKTWLLLGEHEADLVALSFVSTERGWIVGCGGKACRYGR